MRNGLIEIRAKRYYKDPGVRQTCHDVKQTSNTEMQEQAIQTIAQDLIGRNVVGPGDILIPAPQHTGNAEYTKRIAEIVAGETGAVIADILRCVPHFSWFAAKQAGKPVHLGMYLSGTIPAGRRCYFIDNVISTGRTFSEANRLFKGNLRPLVYAVDETKERELLKNGLMIRPSVREKLQNLKTEKASDNMKAQFRAKHKNAERMWSSMAATRLIAMHQNKGKTIARCLKDRTDYAKNGEKTDHGELISSYACDKETVDQEFLLAKQEYYRITGRKPNGDIIAYQIRQSFKPGEITPEEANRVGYETAMRFTKGNHAFIVATHIDRAHIHNHVIFNSTNLDCDRKFRDSWFIALALQKLSDQICLEHALSVITPRKPSERDSRCPYHRESFCSILRENIDRILEDHPKDFNSFLRKLQEAGYESKAGRHYAIRGPGQKRFIRFRSLGEGYTEEDIRKRIAGEMEFSEEEQRDRNGKRRTDRPRNHTEYPGRGFDLLIDINKKMQEGKGKGYERWAKVYNVKQVSRALLFLQEHEIRDYEELSKRAEDSAAKFHSLSDAIKEKEKQLAQIAALKMQIINYAKTKEIYAAYRKSGYSKQFLEQHRQEIMLHKAAKDAFNQLEGKKLPSVKALSAQYAHILAEKKKLYEEYRLVRKEMMNYQVAKRDIDDFLKIDQEQKTENREKLKTRIR